MANSYTVHNDVKAVEGDPESSGFYITDPAHGGKVTCEQCCTFIDEGEDHFHSHARHLWWCRQCGDVAMHAQVPVVKIDNTQRDTV